MIKKGPRLFFLTFFYPNIFCFRHARLLPRAIISIPGGLLLSTAGPALSPAILPALSALGSAFPSLSAIVSALPVVIVFSASTSAVPGYWNPCWSCDCHK